MEYQFRTGKFKIEKSLHGDIVINADVDAVKEVLINLISNSVKYSPEKKIIRICSATENNFAVVKIADEGVGISAKDIDTIFNPYVRLNNSGIKHTGGAGIGLSIVKSIMEAHKGRVEVESTLGKGSSFSLYFRLEPVEYASSVDLTS